MSLEKWSEYGWLRRLEERERLSSSNIADLLRVVERKVRTAEVRDVPPEDRYLAAYGAARRLCHLALKAEGYEAARGEGSHKRVIDSLEHTLGAGQKKIVAYLDRCRMTRNALEYDVPGTDVTESDVDELVAKARGLLGVVIDWLNERHPGLVPSAYRAGK